MFELRNRADLSDLSFSLHQSKSWQGRNPNRTYGMYQRLEYRGMVRCSMRLLRRMRAGLTKHYRIIRVGACTLASTLACTSDPFAKGDATIKYDPEAVTSVAAPSGFPTDGCLQNVSQFASIRESESIVPEGVRSKPAQQDIGWQPWELADIEAGKDRYAVVDRRAASATLFSSDLKRRIHWERKGNGPGELQNPVFGRFDPRGDSKGPFWAVSGQPLWDVAEGS